MTHSRATWRTRVKQSGFTLLELITAMLASTVLVASLAATIVISNELMQTPLNDDEVWHDREIADRIANDLRYATGVDPSNVDGFEITKPNANTGIDETATYVCYMDGLTRQIGSGPIMNLDAEAPGHVHTVDGFTAPTHVSATQYSRLRSSSRASSSDQVPDLDVAVPSGCKPGDHVILGISAKSPTNMTISGAGWQTLRVVSGGNLRLVAVHRTYDASWSDTIRISVAPDSAIAAAMIAVENVNATLPINWTDESGGYALSFLAGTLPTPIEPPTISPRDLSVQIFAAELDPWEEGTMGLAGYVDTIQATAAQNDFFSRNSIGIVVRSGDAPDLSFTPRLLHQTSGVWLQAAIRVEAEP